MTVPGLLPLQAEEMAFLMACWVVPDTKTALAAALTVKPLAAITKSSTSATFLTKVLK